MPENAIVCVIDDDHAARESLAGLLRIANLEVRTYGSATQFEDINPGHWHQALTALGFPHDYR